MHTREILAEASRWGVSLTLPELESDIDAQIRCLIDPEHVKQCVFLARGNSLGGRKLPGGIFVETRPEGTLLTDSAAIAAAYRNLEWITDTMIAEILGYPESKSDLMMRDDVTVIQALDAQKAVIFEAAASIRRMNETIAVAAAQMPFGGQVIAISPDAALARRLNRMN